MDRRLLIVIAVALVVVGIVATSALFIVDQTEQALVLPLAGRLEVAGRLLTPHEPARPPPRR